MAEARGGKEDNALKQEYSNVWNNGTGYMPAKKAQKTLTSRTLKLKAKHANVSGLQLADLLAHPLTRDVLVAEKRIEHHGSEFSASLCKRIETKYNQQEWRGTISGYGRVLLK